MTLDLDELERLERAATPGRWEANDGYYIDATRRQIGLCVSGGNSHQAANDAAFIVAARNALPDLIARVRKAEARVAELEAVAACEGTHVAAHQARARIEFLEDHVAKLLGACRNWRLMGEQADLKAAKLDAERKGNALVAFTHLHELETAGRTGWDNEDSCCPVCEGTAPECISGARIVHEDDCWLAQAIKEASDGR